jgi:hypothetical protein
VEAADIVAFDTSQPRLRMLDAARKLSPKALQRVLEMLDSHE